MEKPVTLGDIVHELGGVLEGSDTLVVSGVASIERAHPSQVSFFSNIKLRNKLSTTQACALIVSQEAAAAVQEVFKGALVIVDDPYLYYAKLAQLFCQRKALDSVSGIHPSAVIDQNAYISPTAYIGPFVFVEAGAVIDDYVRIEAGCVIGQHVKIGKGTHLYPRVTIYHDCEIGQRGLFFSGAVIGKDGFGLAYDKVKANWLRIPQVGKVVIGDDVEVGANTCIDRGALDNTVIADGVKLDNHIQVGHNCQIGSHTVIAGCVGIAGSAHIGSHCAIGGAAMIIGHLTIADHVHIAAGTLISRSIAEAGEYAGVYPFAKKSAWEKSAVILRNIARLRDRVLALEKNLS